MPCDGSGNNDGPEKYFDLSNLKLETISEDELRVSGYVESKIDFIQNKPLTAALRSKYFDKGVWKNAPLEQTTPNFCVAMHDVTTIWYNYTKNWVDCPPKKGVCTNCIYIT